MAATALPNQASHKQYHDIAPHHLHFICQIHCVFVTACATPNISFFIVLSSPHDLGNARACSHSPARLQ